MTIPSFAHDCGFRMKTKGRYKQGWPVGAVVHFTAGRDGAEAVMRYGAKQGYAYWCIERDGDLHCAHDAKEWGYHAGESKWKTLFGAVSDDLIGIEMNAAGKITPQSNGTFKTYWGGVLKSDEGRFSPGHENQQRGWYHKYTPEQEVTLIRTLLWLKKQNPYVFSFDNVLGHDEVAFWRKNDPGAALSMTMPAFRDLLKHEYEKESAA